MAIKTVKLPFIIYICNVIFHKEDKQMDCCSLQLLTVAKGLNVKTFYEDDDGRRNTVNFNNSRKSRSRSK